MKRLIVILIMAIALAWSISAQTEWQGRVARGGPQDFPSEGYYAASNSFTRNSIVAVTNPATGKSVRVVISRGLSDNSLFMTLSNDAARALGLDGSFPATMKAQPVIIPGVSDQSIGSELPFTRDPDINPSASAGDPNAFVFNSQTPPQDIRPQQNDGQAASTDTSTTLQPANTKRVDTVSDIDLNQTSLISDNSKLPTELNNQNAKAAGSEPATSQKPVDTAPLTNLQSADARQVAASDTPEKQPDAALSGQAAALADTGPSPARGATIAGTENLGAAQGAPVQEATLNPGSGIAQGMRNAIDAPVDTTSIAPTQSGAVSRGVASSLRNLRPDQGQTDTAANSNKAAAPNQRGGVMAGAVEKLGQQGLGQTQRPRNQGQTVKIPESRGVGTGIKSLDNLRDRPNTGDVARPDHLFAPIEGQSANKPSEPAIALPLAKDANGQSPAATAVGESLLDQQMAAIAARSGRRQLYTQAKQEGDQALLPSLSAKSVPFRNPDLPTASLKNNGPTDPSLAGQNATNGKTDNGKLPVATKADDGKADPSLAGLSGRQSALGNPRLPLATASDGGKIDPSLAGIAGKNPDGSYSNLAQANAADGGKIDPSLAGTRSGIAAGFRGNLPTATPKGDERPDFTNPYLEGDSSVAGTGVNLPLAQLVPGEIPQATLQGAGPGLALVPEKSDLPLVALDVNQKAQPAFSALNPTQQSIANAKLPTPSSGAAALPEDPVNALRPVQTVVSLEPADYKPPQIPTPNSDRILAEAPKTGAINNSLAEARLRAGQGPEASINGHAAGPALPISADLAAARDPSLPEGAIGMQAPGHIGLGEMNLATANDPKGLNSEALLQAMRPQDSVGSASLATPRDRSIPELFKPGSTPADAAVANPDLTQAKTPNYLSREASIAGAKGPKDIDYNALSVADPKSPNAENLLPGTKPGPGDKSPIAVSPVRPNLPNQGKTTTTQQTQQNQQITQQVTKPNDGKNQTKQPDKQVDVSVVVDDQWAQKNLPLVKNLQREKYYLQVGAFANARSAKTALGDIAPKFPVAVVPEKSASKSVYKVFIGPLNEDEKGLMLYIFRAKGYRDAFIKKTQP